MKSYLLSLLVIFITVSSAQAGAVDDLFAAVVQCDQAGVEKAMADGADVNALNSSGQNALAASFFCDDLTAFLIQKGCDPNGGSYPAVIQAANNYAVATLKMLLEAGADPNKIGVIDGGAHLLKLAEAERAKGKKGNKAMIDAWENAAKLAPRSEVTALQQTIQQTNCIPCLDLLIKHGVDAKGVDANGRNQLFTLAIMGQSQQMRRDGFAKGKVNMETMGMKVPDWYGSLSDDRNGTTADMFNKLMEAGLDLNLIDADQNNPLLVALGMEKVDLAKAMIKAGADVKYMNPKLKRDAVASAAELGDLELLKMLVERGADVTLETWDLDKETGSFCKGFTALARAVIFDNYDCAVYLIDNGCKIREGISGYFAKQAVSSIGGRPLVGVFGDKLYCRYKMKAKTPIYFAIENGNMKMVELLATRFKWYSNHSMEMKAQVNSTADGSALKGACLAASGKFSPSRYAKALEQDEIYRYLMSLGK